MKNFLKKVKEKIRWKLNEQKAKKIQKEIKARYNAKVEKEAVKRALSSIIKKQY
ncbi:hypothetical protein J2W44_006106 [Priestia aryabhattai]|uniref:hypothetical protein n=1 Tax=Priestia aryabhattai TaxID=412384 RepID=UPI0027E561B2|nr:hypothetical protein [Priestia aryabhattai]MDP9726950.1 hypothetical protein [Priestia aryabhattai]